MIAYQKEHGIAKAAVIGGGLLGLEAAKAMYDLGMETHIIEYAPILMCRQASIMSFIKYSVMGSGFPEWFHECPPRIQCVTCDELRHRPIVRAVTASFVTA